MKIVNIDRLVEDLLRKYGEYIGVLCEKERERIARKRYKSLESRVNDDKWLAEVDASYKFLQQIIADPRKYLYHKFDMIYMGVDEDGNVASVSNLNSRLKKCVPVYDGLKGIHSLVNMYDGKNVLLELSDFISTHILYVLGIRRPVHYDKVKLEKQGEVWRYDADGTFVDIEAQGIMKLNQYVSLIRKNELIRNCKMLLPASHFVEPEDVFENDVAESLQRVYSVLVKKVVKLQPTDYAICMRYVAFLKKVAAGPRAYCVPGKTFNESTKNMSIFEASNFNLFKLDERAAQCVYDIMICMRDYIYYSDGKNIKNFKPMYKSQQEAIEAMRLFKRDSIIMTGGFVVNYASSFWNSVFNRSK